VLKIVNDTAKIQFDTLSLGGTTLISWKSKTQGYLVQ